MVTNDQLETAVKKRSPKGTQKNTQAGFKGHFTNYSGKVTCATQLFEENVDEQLIKLQTDHRSDARLFVLTINIMHCKYQIFYNLPCPKRQLNYLGGYHAENKENSVVPTQNFQSNSQPIMHSNVISERLRQP